MMELNRNNEPKYVTGRHYSHGALMRMSKGDLVDLLEIAQHNYEVVNYRLSTLTNNLERLDKALLETCEELHTLQRRKMEGASVEDE